MEENKKIDDKEQSGLKNQDPSKYRHHFQVKYFPKGFFQLFNKTETSYIYDKKFSCELPKNIIPPKSFHYPYSLENFCKSDLLTMDFDLKKNPEILTDPKINTFIHQDFINNSLELIFPNLTTISKKRTDEEQNFKKKIIEIIESNDEVNQEINPFLSEIPDFLRRQTYLRPSTVVNNEKKTKVKEKAKPEKKQKTTLQDLVKSIEQSFNDIDKIKVGTKHPDAKQKGVSAKNVYEISPMDTMPNIKFIEYLFPSEPSEVPNLDEKYKRPDHFLITNNKSNDINQENTSSLYINNKLKTQEDHIEKDSAEYYTYEREFAASKMNSNDLFNRYFLILDKNKKKLKISPLYEKYSFRRYKKMTEANLNNEENQAEGNENKNNDYINKKRKRDIILIPKSMDKEECDEKKNWLKERGYLTGFSERKINKVEHTDVMEIEREREKEEELKKKHSNSEEELFSGNENEENEDEDNIFDENENNNENDEEKSHSKNDEEQNSNDEQKEENDEENKSKEDVDVDENKDESKESKDSKEVKEEDENKEQDDEENLFD